MVRIASVAGALLAATLSWAQQPVLLENDWVKVISAQNVPGQKSRLHRHAVDRLMVHLDPGRLRLTDESGEYRDAVFGPLEVRWDPAGGLHTSENVGGNSIRIVEVEFKRAGETPTAAAPAGGSAVVVEQDRPQARVLRLRLAPGQRAALDSRSKPALIIGLGEAKLRLEGPSGERSVEVEMGGISWEEGRATNVRNAGAAAAEFLYVEVR
jgi:hypothetical protein